MIQTKHSASAAQSGMFIGQVVVEIRLTAQQGAKSADLRAE
jgi:hypothetical protein